MKLDPLQAYVRLQQKLLTEKAYLEKRLQGISQALEGTVVAAPAPVRAAARRGRPPKSRLPNKMSLPEAVMRVTAKASLGRQEILEAVQRLGYRFLAKDPMKSINPILYGKRVKFIREDGKFRLAPGSAKSAAAGKAEPARKPRKKFSAKARARLSAIAKARWAKVKAAGKRAL